MGSLKTFALIILLQIIITESARVSPKLDFEDQSELVQVKKEIKTATGKIKNLRVTVDTSELKGSPESRSSGSDSSVSNESLENKKQTVGVRTDVTFEITSGETNDTKTIDEKEIGKDDDNASIPMVPVFKGTPDRDNPSPPRGRPSYPNRNFDDRNSFGGSSDSSNQFPLYEIWTTERYNRKHDQPVYHHRGQYDNIYPQKPSINFIPYHRHQPWQPCTCKEYPGPSIHPHHSSSSSVEYHRNTRIDDKLERPFSKTS